MSYSHICSGGHGGFHNFSGGRNGRHTFQSYRHNFATLVEVITSLCNVAGDGVHIPLGCGCDGHITVTVLVLTIL